MRKFIFLTMFIILTMFLLSGCGKDIMEIQSHETAFLIPLTGDTSEQNSFKSSEFLSKNKVAGKRIEIPYDWIWFKGNYPRFKLLKVDRTPVTRECTEEIKTGTSKSNQGFIAESIESIGFMARFSCTCRIEESDAALYLYRYPSGKKLSEVIDLEVRTSVENYFGQECSKMTMEEIIHSKGKLSEIIKNKVVTDFKKEGITISTLGLKGELTYLDPKIQQAINSRFVAEKEKSAQELINQKNIEKAKADKQVVEIQSATMEKTLKLQEIEVLREMIKKWDGKLPQFGNDILNSLFKKLQ